MIMLNIYKSNVICSKQTAIDHVMAEMKIMSEDDHILKYAINIIYRSWYQVITKVILLILIFGAHLNILFIPMCSLEELLNGHIMSPSLSISLKFWGQLHLECQSYFSTSDAHSKMGERSKYASKLY